MTMPRSEVRGHDAMMVEPAPPPPANIEEALKAKSDDEVAEMLCEIVASIPDESSPGHMAARQQRNHLARLWNAYMGGEPVREVLRELMYHFDAFPVVEWWRTRILTE